MKMAPFVLRGSVQLNVINLVETITAFTFRGAVGTSLAGGDSPVTELHKLPNKVILRHNFMFHI